MPILLECHRGINREGELVAPIFVERERRVDIPDFAPYHQ